MSEKVYKKETTSVNEDTDGNSQQFIDGVTLTAKRLCKNQCEHQKRRPMTAG